MDSLKTPGIDGFDVFFFKNTSHIIGDSIIAVVQNSLTLVCSLNISTVLLLL